MGRVSRLAPRVDANHREIADALRRVGIGYHSTAMVGGGFPDAVWTFRGKTGLLEAKAPGGKLNSAQKRFIESWGGVVIVAHDAEEAIVKIVMACREESDE